MGNTPADNAWKCPVCGKTFRAPGNHMVQHKGIKIVDWCEVCGKEGVVTIQKQDDFDSKREKSVELFREMGWELTSDDPLEADAVCSEHSLDEIQSESESDGVVLNKRDPDPPERVTYEEEIELDEIIEDLTEYEEELIKAIHDSEYHAIGWLRAGKETHPDQIHRNQSRSALSACFTRGSRNLQKKGLAVTGMGDRSRKTSLTDKGEKVAERLADGSE